MVTRCDVIWCLAVLISRSKRKKDGDTEEIDGEGGGKEGWEEYAKREGGAGIPGWAYSAVAAQRQLREASVAVSSGVPSGDAGVFDVGSGGACIEGCAGESTHWA